MKTDTAADQARAFQKRFYRAIIERDDVFMKEHLHSGFTFTSADAELRNKEAFIQGVVLNANLRFAQIRTFPEVVTIAGSTAVLSSKAEMNILHGDQSIAFSERLTETFVDSGNGWQVVAVQGTYIPEK